MLKKMRWRFIGSAMAAFAAVVLSLLCVVNLWNYFSMTRQQDATLDRLLEVDSGEREVPEGKDMPPFASMERFSPEVPYMIRFFSVRMDGAGNVERFNQDYIASVSEEEAEGYAETVLARGKDRGYEGGYRYLVSYEGEGTVVLFLNSERELQTMQTLLWITLAIAGGSLAVVFLLVVLFSRRAIAPYLKNMEAQKQFITNASHELKTPLTAIATSADVLAMEYAEDEWVQNIQSQAGKLSKLITNLVTLSRLDEEDPFPTKSEFSLSEVLWELCEPFGPLAKAKGKSFSQKIDNDLNAVGDRTAIQQLFSILLDNALKYSPDGGSITLTAKQNGKKAEVAVFNTVDPEENRDLSRLFDRFYRADESHSGAVGGTGIGLSIAKATVQAHGGKISVKQTGDTICFKVVL